MIGVGLGGFGVGFLEKTFGDKIPTLPVVGKKGAIAIAAYYFADSKRGWVEDVGIAAAALAGYEFGTTGKITGSVMGEDDGGLAAQM